jgi:hypothetical protein
MIVLAPDHSFASEAGVGRKLAESRERVGVARGDAQAPTSCRVLIDFARGAGCAEMIKIHHHPRRRGWSLQRALRSAIIEIELEDARSLAGSQDPHAALAALNVGRKLLRAVARKAIVGDEQDVLRGSPVLAR